MTINEPTNSTDIWALKDTKMYIYVLNASQACSLVMSAMCGLKITLLYPPSRPEKGSAHPASWLPPHASKS